jgi:hypothetical protein
MCVTKKTKQNKQTNKTKQKRKKMQEIKIISYLLCRFSIKKPAEMKKFIVDMTAKACFKSRCVIFSEVGVTRSLALCVVFCRSLFFLFLLAIGLSDFLRFTDFDFPVF